MTHIYIIQLLIDCLISPFEIRLELSLFDMIYGVEKNKLRLIQNVY